uniref:Uncharacterized protein n=1 Tax=Romanomermis culicivorax TaxID=13658 RepID=A0A915J925_ROMCU
MNLHRQTASTHLNFCSSIWKR